MGRSGVGVEVRGNSLRIYFTIKGKLYRERLSINGKSIEATTANIKYANRVASEIRKKIALGTFEFIDYFPDSPRANNPESEPTTLGGLAALWLESKGRLAEATLDQYGTAIRFWNKLLGERTLISDLTHKMLAAKIGGYPWPSAKTHNNYLIALRGILGLEYRGAKVMHDPLLGIENMPVVKRLPDPMTVEERDKILADMHKRCDARVTAYFQWQFFTGMRPEEAIALRWSDVDLARGVVRVQRVRTFKGGERDGSKTNTVRDVDLLPQTLAALQVMKPYTFTLRMERDGDHDTSADIFQNPVTGRPWHDERSQRDTYWRPTVKRLGIRWRPAYNTRHTYATVALMAGVPLAYIAHQLGHSVKMLLDKYARWIPGNDLGNARQMLEAAMGNFPILSQNKTG